MSAFDLQIGVMLRECTYDVIVCQLYCLLLFELLTTGKSLGDTILRPLNTIGAEI